MQPQSTSGAKLSYYQRTKDHPRWKRYNDTYYSNPENRLKLSIDRKAKRAAARIELLKYVGGGVCKECGFDDWRALQIDHIKGGGVKQRKIVGSIMSNPIYYRKIIEQDKDAYQVLCANCNWIKRHTNAECADINLKYPRTLH